MGKVDYADRLRDPEGRAWLKAAMKTVNAPLPTETLLESMVAHVLDKRPNLDAALRIAALIEEVPGQTLANIVAHRVFRYKELEAAMRRIRVFHIDVTETANGRWVAEMARFEVERSSA